MLYSIIISPIELIVDWIFNFAINKLSQLGVIGAIVSVSLVINFLALPIYNIADNLQEKERNIAKKLEPQVKRIKKAFKGDEQYMILSTYYKQNKYHPLYTLRSSLSILIEIPFFIAAYHYLSNNEILKGASWWIFSDLGKPDNFLPFHILPFLMTGINFVSGAIYTKNSVLREKIQLYVVATIFLVLLDNSPSGLVLYWILNNTFSLAKNILSRKRNSSRVVFFATSLMLLLFSGALLVKTLFNIDGNLWKKISFFIFAVILFCIPFLIKRISASKTAQLMQNCFYNLPASFSLLIFSGLGIALLLGLIIPSGIIASSPIEFSYLGKTNNPLSYVITSTCVFLGLFIVWPFFICKMFGAKTRKIFSLFFFIMFICALTNVFIFKFDYGMLNIFFNIDIYEIEKFTPFFIVLPILVVCGALGIYLLGQKKAQLLALALSSVCFAELCYGVIKCNKINTEFSAYKQSLAANTFSEEKVYNLSKDGKNVIVIFLDAALGAFFPYTLEQFPEIKEQFAGAIFYPNTISFSTHTVKGFPPMAGGYEYIPERMNERANEPLRIKHNEASLVMPRLFMDAGFEATVTDPPDPNYTWKGDLTPFTDQGIKAKELARVFSTKYIQEKNIPFGEVDTICKREIRNFAVIQAIYPPLRSIFHYAARRPIKDENTFIDEFSILYYLPSITDFSATKNTFTFIGNGTTHEPVFLHSDYETPNQIAENAENEPYQTSIDDDRMHYEINVAAIKQIAKFFDYLRQNNCFDNTRIIITADHGRGMKITPPFEDFTDVNPPNFNPLLIVKDFDSNEALQFDYTFMTNADTLFLAKEGLELGNKNPFTQKELVQEKENGGIVWQIAGGEWKLRQVVDKNIFTLDKEGAWRVKDNIFEKNNYSRPFKD